MLVCLHGFHESVPEHRIPAFLHTCLKHCSDQSRRIILSMSSQDLPDRASSRTNKLTSLCLTFLVSIHEIEGNLVKDLQMPQPFPARAGQLQEADRSLSLG